MKRRKFLRNLFGLAGIAAIGPAILISKPDSGKYIAETDPYINDVERSIVQGTWLNKQETEFLGQWEKQKELALRTYMTIHKRNHGIMKEYTYKLYDFYDKKDPH